nr:hypothetical protein CFP56_04308 [Quercus suber]
MFNYHNVQVDIDRPPIPVLPSMPTQDDPPRRRRKEYDRERDSTSTRHRSSTHKSSSSTKLHRIKRSPDAHDRERDRDSPRSSVADENEPRRTPIVVPEMKRRPSGTIEVKSRTSYPSFSKAHSREMVGSREEIGLVKATEHTITPTNLSEDKKRHSAPTDQMPTQKTPPSPPLTADEPDIRRSRSGGSMRKAERDRHQDAGVGKKAVDSPARGPGVKSYKSGVSLRKEARFQESEVSSMPGAFPEEDRKSTPNSGYRRTVSTGSQPTSELTQATTTTTDSDATSIAPERKARHPKDNMVAEEHSPPSVTDSQPRTPTQVCGHPARPTKTPVIDVDAANLDSPASFGTTPLTAVPPPPPPPPPMSGSKEVPRVDYLLKHGGLPTPIPKRLVQMGPQVQQYNMYSSPVLMQQVPLEEYAKVFTGIHKRLDDYVHVLRNHGSLAVATGYKSVARRLLDKLSQVFARDISSQRCDCVMCNTMPQNALSDEEDSGFSWGEILEFTAGRRELPQWPPFAIQPDEGGLGITGATAAPMQKLDIDVPEEYREHYIRQNQKTKRAVHNWLSQQDDFPSSPPEEADEDTLMFAMMTKLTVEQRNLFIALMHGQSTVSQSRAPTPAERPSSPSDVLKRTKQALQRLYRLDKPPRDCESAIYLLNNSHLHGMLATLAEVNEAEWEILVSGRFDGFLWSGAEAPFPPSASQWASQASISRGPSRNANATPFSRNTTPFSGLSAMPPSRGPTPLNPLRNITTPANANGPSIFPSRGPTPAPNGVGFVPPAPVQLDEDTEIAVLAEVERNLFNDMERFEDAFEILHSRAEMVRQMLRERSAGLGMAAQMRRGSWITDDDFVRLGTPASGVTDFEDSEDDDGLGDVVSLAPDDSASQISVNRRHRHRRERRTPAPVAEEDESAYEEPPPRRPATGGGRRSKY